VCSPKGGVPKGVSSREFLNLKKMHKYKNLLLHKQFSFYFLVSFPFCKKKYFHGNMGMYKIGGASPA